MGSHGVEGVAGGASADGGKQDSGEDVGGDEEHSEKCEQSAAFGVEELASLEGQGEEDEEVGAVGEEHIPLEGGDRAHGDEGEEDKEVAVGLDEAQCVRGNSWIGGQQPEGEHERGHGDEGEGTDDGGLGFAIDGKGVVVEEAAEEVVVEGLGAGGWFGCYVCLILGREKADDVVSFRGRCMSSLRTRRLWFPPLTDGAGQGWAPFC